MYMSAHWTNIRTTGCYAEKKTYTPSPRFAQAFPNLIPLPCRVLGSRIVLSQSLDGDRTVVTVAEELGGRGVVWQEPHDNGYASDSEEALENH